MLQMIQRCVYDTNGKEKGERRKDKGESKEMNIRQWEEFPVGPGGDGEHLHVTLGKKGEIMIGAKAFEKFGKPEAAVLLFDRVNSVIGLMPAHTRRAENAYPLIVKTNGRHRVVRANRFCRHYGIKVERTIAFNKPEIDGEGILVLDLKATAGLGREKDKG